MEEVIVVKELRSEGFKVARKGKLNSGTYPGQTPAVPRPYPGRTHLRSHPRPGGPRAPGPWARRGGPPSPLAPGPPGSSGQGWDLRWVAKSRGQRQGQSPRPPTHLLYAWDRRGGPPTGPRTGGPWSSGPGARPEVPPPSPLAPGPRASSGQGWDRTVRGGGAVQE